MGRQLWRLLLANEIGTALLDKLEDPELQPMRLQLVFHDDADTTLRGLPWEFLHGPGNEGFLAGRTQLLLTRHVPIQRSRRKLMPVSSHDRLRVLLVAALPEEDRDVRTWRGKQALTKLHKELRNISGLDTLEPIETWDSDEITRRLARARDDGKPIHIVHVVGSCKGPPGEPRIFLGGEGDGYVDPQPVVDVLGADAAGLQLVVLQLCDLEDGDASENFERLAPDLVTKGVPAVLALQYAALADEVGVGRELYERLVKGERIGSAVQESRQALLAKVDRRFATPVLYLGEDGPLVREVARPPSSTPAKKLVSTDAARKVRGQLRDVVWDMPELSMETRQRLTTWIHDLPLEDDPRQSAVDQIRLMSRGPIERDVLEALSQMARALSAERGTHGVA